MDNSVCSVAYPTGLGGKCQFFYLLYKKVEGRVPDLNEKMPLLLKIVKWVLCPNMLSDYFFCFPNSTGGIAPSPRRACIPR